ncbi:PAS domain S-box protein [Candidatus Harpocratesius sp.]
MNQIADFAFVLDMITKITQFAKKDNILKKSKEVFQMLFAPKIIEYYKELPEHLKSQCNELETVPFMWIFEETALIIPIKRNEYQFGFIYMEDFKFPEYRKRYLTPALLVTKVLALSLQNSENFEKIAKSEEKFRLFIEYTVNWEYWYHPMKGFLYISPSFETITGYTPEEGYADPNILDRIIFPEDLPLFHDFFSLNKKTIEFRIKSKSGKIVWIAHSATKIISETGEFMGIRASNADITEKKQKEFEVDRLKSMIPICASCKKIRTDDGYWNQIESYISSISNIEFTHSLCPECAKKIFPENEEEER